MFALPHPVSNDTLPVTVIVPTLGRAEFLRPCLESLTRCSPRASEIVVVDGGEETDAAALVECFASAGARRIGGSRRGVATGGQHWARGSHP